MFYTGPLQHLPPSHLPPSAALSLLYKYLLAIPVRAPVHRAPGEVLGLVVKNFASGSNDVRESEERLCVCVQHDTQFGRLVV